MYILQFCPDPKTSNKKLFPTFVRTRPPDTQVSKSVVSLLLKFNWKRIAILYSKSKDSDRDLEAVALTIQATVSRYNIECVFTSAWTTTFHYGYTENPFHEIVKKSFKKARSRLNFYFF